MWADWLLQDGHTSGMMALIVLGTLIVWETLRGIRALLKMRYPAAWRASIRLMGWIPAALTAWALAVGLLLNVLVPDLDRHIPQIGALRVTGTIIPLAFGALAAYAFSPDEEPAFEVMLAAPRPVAWTMLERVGMAAAVLGGIGLLGSVTGIRIAGSGDFIQLLVEWVPAAIFLGGLGAYITMMSGQTLLGVMVLAPVWIMLVFQGDALLPHPIPPDFANVARLISFTASEPDAIFLAGGPLAAITTGMPIAGAAVTVFSQFGTAIAGKPLLIESGIKLEGINHVLATVQPYLWPFHIYLRPGILPAADYGLNRIVVSVTGLALFALAARHLRDEERLLTGARRAGWLRRLVSGRLRIWKHAKLEKERAS